MTDIVVKKRNGEFVPFDKNKIIDALTKAFDDTERGLDYDLVCQIADDIEEEILEVPEVIPTVESINDMCEDFLMDSERKDVARAFILYREERKAARNKVWEMNDLQRDIYERKYRFGNETFDEFLNRVSGGDTKISKLMREKKFLPAGRTLAGRGLNEKGRKVCYSNCFVITPPKDNLESIFDTAKKMARTYSYGGGCGTSLGNLRPRNSKVNNAAQSTTGSVSFADLYSMTTGLIGQNSRRGALMLSMPVTHPDILEFINVKSDLSKVTKANISVMVNDEFMKAVKNNEVWEMKFTVKDTDEIIVKKERAREIMYQIALNNWRMAEPGLLNWSRVENWHLNSENKNFEYTSTNPCGEKPLPSGGSCLLSSFNLSEYIINPFTKDAYFNDKDFVQDVKDVVVYMNNLLDEGIQYLPLDEQKHSATQYRQLGIGVMGIADAFIKMGMKYGDKRSQKLIGEILHLMANASLQQSAILARDLGTYPAYDKQSVLASPYLNFVATPETFELVEKYGLYNAELLSIAPTGSLSTMWGISGGGEPIFALSHTRKSESLGDNGEDVYYKVYAQIAREYMDLNGNIREEDLPSHFITAMELDYRDRIDIQSVMQKYIDSAISSTVNLPEDVTVEEIMDLYLYAWEKGLKGVTIYRENCERSGILVADKPKETAEPIQAQELEEQECAT